MTKHQKGNLNCQCDSCKRYHANPMRWAMENYLQANDIVDWDDNE